MWGLGWRIGGFQREENRSRHKTRDVWELCVRGPCDDLTGWDVNNFLIGDFRFSSYINSNIIS